ncbi:sensor histidine kinase [Allorhizocola rhizosphaerae]|uniref:sensor histidine kinase n=1 Tax=Allorhizocola rhizosphaerae TaxID=1872709 RepID=UPI000E3DCC93|nr:sensor histidine kinase [Allorhizocola rhizosphaerae]
MLKVSLARQFLLFQLGIVVLVVGAVAAVSLAEADSAFRSEQGERLRSTAEALAANDSVRQGFGSAAWHDSLAALAETNRAVSGPSFVLLIDANGMLLNGSDKGRPAAMGDSDALTGRSWEGVIDRALVAHAPVLDAANGRRVLGVVAVGKSYPTTWELLSNSTRNLLTYLLLGSAIGVAGSLLLARRVKRQTLGLEPNEIAGLVEHREAMLHGIKEGLMGVDTSGRVTLANDEAIRLLDLPRNPVGSSLRALGLDMLIGASAQADEVVLHHSRVLVLNRMPVLVRGQTVGSVTTLRDQTELTSLQRELDVSRHATDTLRAQAHEFTNRLHTISGLVQLGHYEEAVNFIMQASRAQESLSREVQSRIADPALAALIVAKSSVAAEQHVRLELDPATSLPGPVDEVLSSDLVTVAGNLIDNAVDAVEAGGWVNVLIGQTGAAVTVTVRDSGDGVAKPLADKVFTSGFTTKGTGGHRGLGLALVRQICRSRGGTVKVDGATFTAELGAVAR